MSNLSDWLDDFYSPGHESFRPRPRLGPARPPRAPAPPQPPGEDKLQRMMAVIHRRTGGNTAFTASEMADNAYELLDSAFTYRYRYNTIMELFVIEFDFRATLEAALREESCTQLLQEWEDMMHTSVYQTLLQWRFKMANNQWKSTEVRAPVAYAALDTDAIMAMLIDQSGGGRHYEDESKMFEQNGVRRISLQIQIIPTADSAGAGKRARQLPAFVTAYPVQTPMRNGVPAPAPSRAKKRLKTQNLTTRILPRGKLVKDCHTTQDRRDCAARCLAYLYFKQYSSVGPDPQKRFDFSGTLLKATNWANYYNSDAPKKAIAVASLKLLQAAGIDPTAAVDAVTDLAKFTRPEALGACAQIHVFKPFTTAAGVEYVERTPTILHSTPDTRSALNAVQQRIQNEQDVRRGNFRSIFDLKQALAYRPTQHYALWLQDGHYHAIHNTDIHLLYKPRNAYVGFCFHCLKPHVKSAMDECVRRQEEKQLMGSVCINCGTTRCDATAYQEEDDEKKTIQCQTCHIEFLTPLCYQLHTEVRSARKGAGRRLLKSVNQCKTRFKCLVCTEVLVVEDVRHKYQHKRNCLQGVSALQQRCMKKCGHCYETFSKEDDWLKHDCWLKARSKRARQVKGTYDEHVYYVDFETYVLDQKESNEDEEPDKTHRVNHVCVQHANGTDKWSFKTIQEFITFVFDEDYHMNTGGKNDNDALMKTFIAHNGRAYDWPTLLAAIHKFTNLPYANCTQGSKLMFVSFLNNPDPSDKNPKLFDKERRLLSQVRLIDSLSFIPRALAAFPSMFGFEGAKGWWPHAFNLPGNWAYSGSIPGIEFYEPQGFTERGFQEFWVWYVEQIYLTNESDPLGQVQDSVRWLDAHCRGDEALNKKLEVFLKQWAATESVVVKPAFQGAWVFETMLDLYCDMDVTILRKGFEAFRTFNLNLFPGDEDKGLDPARYVSITGLCLDIWLNKWYPPLTFPPLPYELAETALRPSFHGGRTGAAILRFMLKCYLRPVAPLLFCGKRLSKRAHVKAKDLRSSYPFQCHSRPYPTGLPIVFNNAQEFVEYFVGSPARLEQWPGNPKEYTPEVIAKWLGNATKLSTERGWQHVMDTMVLNLLLDDCPDSLAVIKLTFEGPEGLCFPVLPANVEFKETRTRVNKITGISKTTTSSMTKLIFDLFEHVDQTKTTISLKRARLHGYAFKGVKQIIYWPRKQCIVGLWKCFVEKFYGNKLAAEGWPAGVTTPEQKAKFIRQLNRDFPGMGLKEADIRKDAGRYAMSKIMVTSNWGRLVMGSNKANTDTFRDHQVEEYWALLRDPTVRIHDIVLQSETAVKVRHSKKAEYARLSPKTCVTVGIFTTEWGRDRLYDGIAQLKPEQVLYYDTDSIYYIADPKHYPDIKSGSKLGDWSDDLNKVGTPDNKKVCIVDFWAGSAKNYGYTKAPLDINKRWDVEKHKQDIKIKSFNLNRGWLDSGSSMNTLTYNHCVDRIESGYEDLAERKQAAPVTFPLAELEVRRFNTAPTMNKVTVMAKQSYRFRYDKRQIAPELCQRDPVTGRMALIRTLPYGYKKTRVTGQVVKDYGVLCL